MHGYRSFSATRAHAHEACAEGETSSLPRSCPGAEEGFLSSDVSVELTRLTQRRDEEIDLARAALLLARREYPNLAVEPYVERLDGIASRSRRMRGMMAQGLDPRRMEVDWQRLRESGRDAAAQEARLYLLLDRIASAENIAASDEELSAEIGRMAAGSRQTPEALRARLTKEGRLDSLRGAIRSEKVVDFLLSHARLTAPGRG